MPQPDQNRIIDPDQLPRRQQQDWDLIETGAVHPARPGEPEQFEDPALESLEEEDDNPYQESDEALPSDEVEQAISRDPSLRPTRSAS